RRVRALPPAVRRQHAAALARPGAGAAGRRRGGGGGGAAARRGQRRGPRSRRRRTGVVMATVFLLAVLFVAVATTAFVAAPLRRRSPRSWLVLMAAVPVLTVALYQVLGTPAALDPAARAPVDTAAATHVDPAEFAEAVSQLRAELERNPQQPEGWVLLGRSLSVQGDHAGARDAYARALELVPDEPALMVEL